MENGLVLLVMKLNTVMDVSKFLMRGPRLNQKNEIHVDKVWGKQVKDHVWIPRIVDDYIHWMCGIDL